MARSRNIKPAFFHNDKLADLCPLSRLLFIGLWTISDFKGELELRPKRIKAQILPYDNCNVEKILTNLDESGFITIYNFDNERYIHINNFLKHQNPHPNEKRKGSEVPKLSQGIDSKGVTINRDKKRSVSEDSITDRADSLIPYPDSCSPHPDSLESDSPNLKPSKTLVALKPDPAQEVFKYWQVTLNHKRAAFDSKRKALIRKNLKHYSQQDLMKAIHGCSVTPFNMGDNDRGEKYDSIELILRDSAHIDKFMRHSDSPPTGNVKTIEQFKAESSAQAQRVMKSLGAFENE